MLDDTFHRDAAGAFDPDDIAIAEKTVEDQFERLHVTEYGDPVLSQSRLPSG